MTTTRKADIADLTLIRKLALEIWPETYKDILSPAQIDYMMNLMYSESSLQNQMKQSSFIIAYENKTPVGFASYGEKKDGIFKLHKIYVLKNRQGKGIGKAIFDYVSDEVLNAGGRTLDLDVNRHNPAKNFYEKLGFRIVAEQDTDIGNGYFMNDFVMRKELNAKISTNENREN